MRCDKFYFHEPSCARILVFSKPRRAPVFDRYKYPSMLGISIPSGCLFLPLIIVDRSRYTPSLIWWRMYRPHHIIARPMKRATHIITLCVVLGCQSENRFIVRTNPQRIRYVHQVEKSRKIVEMGNPDARRNAVQKSFLAIPLT